MDRAAKTNHAKNAAGHERVSAFRPVRIFPQSDQCSIPITRRSTLPLNAVPPFPQTNPPTNLKPLTSFTGPESLPSQKQQLPGSEYAAPNSEAVFPTLREKQLSEPIPLFPQYNPILIAETPKSLFVPATTFIHQTNSQGTRKYVFVGKKHFTITWEQLIKAAIISASLALCAILILCLQISKLIKIPIYDMNVNLALVYMFSLLALCASAGSFSFYTWSAKEHSRNRNTRVQAGSVNNATNHFPLARASRQ